MTGPPALPIVSELRPRDKTITSTAAYPRGMAC